MMALALLAALIARTDIWAEHGTLITAVRTPDSVLVCADKRRLLPGNQHVDTIDKLQVPNERTVAFVHGNTISIYNGRALDAPALIKRFFDERKEIGDPADLWTYLVQESDRVLSTFPAARWAELHQADSEVFGVTVFSARDGSVQKASGGIRARVEGGRITVGATGDGRFEPFVQRITVHGNSKVLIAIRNGGDPALEEARNDAAIKRILLTPETETIGPTPVDQALSFARKVVQLTNLHSTRVGGLADVSPTCDCLLLRAAGGVERK